LINEVRRNRVENIVFLAPPGGIPQDMAVQFENLRRQLIIKGDVRLDIVLVGAATVPHELRDISIGTGGSVVTVTDVDEIGAVAQRIKNDQTTGCWVVLPHQDTIVGRYKSPQAHDQRAPTRWLVDDPSRGTFPVEPIDGPSIDVLGRLGQLADYFKLYARNELSNANVLTLGAISSIVTSAQHALEGEYFLDNPEKHVWNGPNRAIGSGPSKNEDETEEQSGLIREIGTIRLLVCNWNKRMPGTNNDARLELLERLIRARSLLDELQTLHEIAEKPHLSLVAPDFDEQPIFLWAFREAARLERDRAAGIPPGPPRRPPGAFSPPAPADEAPPPPQIGPPAPPSGRAIAPAKVYPSFPQSTPVRPWRSHRSAGVRDATSITTHWRTCSDADTRRRTTCTAPRWF